jgi:hypothetical protein
MFLVQPSTLKADSLTMSGKRRKAGALRMNLSVRGGYKLAIQRNVGHASADALLSHMDAPVTRYTVSRWEQQLASTIIGMSKAFIQRALGVQGLEAFIGNAWERLPRLEVKGCEWDARVNELVVNFRSHPTQIRGFHPSHHPFPNLAEESRPTTQNHPKSPLHKAWYSSHYAWLLHCHGQLPQSVESRHLSYELHAVAADATNSNVGLGTKAHVCKVTSRFQHIGIPTVEAAVEVKVEVKIEPEDRKMMSTPPSAANYLHPHLKWPNDGTEVEGFLNCCSTGVHHPEVVYRSGMQVRRNTNTSCTPRRSLRSVSLLVAGGDGCSETSSPQRMPMLRLRVSRATLSRLAPAASPSLYFQTLCPCPHHLVLSINVSCCSSRLVVVVFGRG